MTIRPLLAALVLCAACSATPHKEPPPLTEAMYPWHLQPPSALPGDFLWQQRLTAHVAGEEHSLKAVLQKQGNHMVLIGLTPFGTKAFLLEQLDMEVRFQSFVDRKLPFPPRFVLNDVQRCYLALGDPATQPKDGEERVALDGEELVQTFVGGHLSERRFRRLDGKPAGEVRVIYRNWTAAGVAQDVVLDNRWFGYSMDIETLSAKALPPAP